MHIAVWDIFYPGLCFGDGKDCGSSVPAAHFLFGRIYWSNSHAHMLTHLPGLVTHLDLTYTCLQWSPDQTWEKQHFALARINGAIFCWWALSSDGKRRKICLRELLQRDDRDDSTRWLTLVKTEQLYLDSIDYGPGRKGLLIRAVTVSINVLK